MVGNQIRQAKPIGILTTEADHPVWVKAGFRFYTNVSADRMGNVRRHLDKAGIQYRISEKAYDINGRRLLDSRALFIKGNRDVTHRAFDAHFKDVPPWYI